MCFPSLHGSDKDAKYLAPALVSLAHLAPCGQIGKHTMEHSTAWLGTTQAPTVSRHPMNGRGGSMGNPHTHSHSLSLSPVGEERFGGKAK